MRAIPFAMSLGTDSNDFFLFQFLCGQGPLCPHWAQEAQRAQGPMGPIVPAWARHLGPAPGSEPNGFSLAPRDWCQGHFSLVLKQGNSEARLVPGRKQSNARQIDVRGGLVQGGCTRNVLWDPCGLRCLRATLRRSQEGWSQRQDRHQLLSRLHLWFGPARCLNKEQFGHQPGRRETWRQ